MNQHASRQTDLPRVQHFARHGLRPWQSLAMLALTGLVAGLALVQATGSDVSAATLDAPPLEAEAPILTGASTLSPEVSEALPFP